VTDTCFFCRSVLAGRDRPLLAETSDVVAFEDNFGSGPGHTLVIPRRHVGRVLDLTDAEYADLFSVGRAQLRRLDAAQPDGYTIGINDGPAAGQSVPHVHLHLIPRRHGDTANPRGGIRWAIPETAAYWEGARRST
jgi:diadenosine tetraphosphate (Ap4A) HIT family hydrolase